MDQGFQKLERSLIDVIKEEQAKLGYQKEKIQLYYPLFFIESFFQCTGQRRGDGRSVERNAGVHKGEVR